MNGNEDDDIVIAGQVTALNPAALTALLNSVRTAWTTGDSYDVRKTNVSALLITGTNVLDDSAIDTLGGNADRDLFFAKLTGPNTDSILDKALNEFVL